MNKVLGTYFNTIKFRNIEMCMNEQIQQIMTILLKNIRYRPHLTKGTDTYYDTNCKTQLLLYFKTNVIYSYSHNETDSCIIGFNKCLILTCLAKQKSVRFVKMYLKS